MRLQHAAGVLRLLQDRDAVQVDEANLSDLDRAIGEPDIISIVRATHIRLIAAAYRVRDAAGNIGYALQANGCVRCERRETEGREIGKDLAQEVGGQGAGLINRAHGQQSYVHCDVQLAVVLTGWTVWQHCGEPVVHVSVPPVGSGRPGRERDGRPGRPIEEGRSGGRLDGRMPGGEEEERPGAESDEGADGRMEDGRIPRMLDTIGGSSWRSASGCVGVGVAAARLKMVQSTPRSVVVRTSIVGECEKLTEDWVWGWFGLVHQGTPCHVLILSEHGRRRWYVLPPVSVTSFAASSMLDHPLYQHGTSNASLIRQNARHLL